MNLASLMPSVTVFVSAMAAGMVMKDLGEHCLLRAPAQDGELSISADG